MILPLFYYAIGLLEVGTTLCWVELVAVLLWIWALKRFLKSSSLSASRGCSSTSPAGSVTRANPGRQWLLTDGVEVSLPSCCRSAIIAAMLVGTAAQAQTVPASSLPPTGDQQLYGKNSPSACAPIGSRRSGGGFKGDSSACLSRRERRLRRHQYQDLHRSEFPAVYYPGVE